MTLTERTEALKPFGYTEREAAFLTLAALHSGYFVRRQFNCYLGQTPGRPDAELVRKVLANRHAKREPTAQRAQVYHLCSHPFYRALGQEDNRHRRDRAPLAVKAKLMGLDFVLAHPGVEFLATEQDKLDYFHCRLGVDLETLPQKTYRSGDGAPPTARFFIEKYPIFLEAQRGCGPPVVSFCYVDEGVLSTSGFESFLTRYGALLQRLGRARLVYVAEKVRNLPAAERKFERFLAKLRGGTATSRGADQDAVAEYFELRRLYDARQFAALDKDKLDRLSRYMRRFAGSDAERRYEAWLSGNRQDSGAAERSGREPKAVGVEFETVRLRHNYDLFGTVS